MNKYKLILFILAFCLSCSLSHAQYLSKLRLPHNITDTINSTQTLTEKSPLLAGTLSFIVPGLALGQFYNGQILKGVLHVSISGMGFVLFLSGMGPGGSNTSTAYAGFLLYLGNWIYTTFEAISAAENINKQIKLQKYRSDIMNRVKLGFNVDKNKQFNLKFAIEL